MERVEDYRGTRRSVHCTQTMEGVEDSRGIGTRNCHLTSRVQYLATFCFSAILELLKRNKTSCLQTPNFMLEGERRSYDITLIIIEYENKRIITHKKELLLYACKNIFIK